MAKNLKTTETERRMAFAWRCSKCINRAARICGNNSKVVSQFVAILRESFSRSIPISDCSRDLCRAQEKFFYLVLF